MPRVIPSGGRDETSAFLARNAAAEDALARLYMALIARREDRSRNEALQRELLGARQGFESQQQNSRQDFERERLRYLYPDLGDQPDNRPNPFGGGGAQHDPQAVATPAQPAPTQPAPIARPGDPPAGGFLPGATGAPSTERFSSNQQSPTAALASVMPANTQDDGSDPGALPPGAQYTQGTIPPGFFNTPAAPTAAQTPGRIPGNAARSRQPPGEVKYAPQQRPTRRQPTKGPAQFREMHPQWVAAMDAAEDKYQLPRGVLLGLYGYENNGGNDLGRSGKGTADGLFKFTDETRAQYGVRPEDKLNPGVMIEAAARNLRHNANVYKQLSGGKELPTDPRYTPFWMALHEWGAGDGPRLVHAALGGSDLMPATDVMLKDMKLPNGQVRDNYSALVNNEVPGNSTVRDIMQRIATRAVPWYESGIKLRTSQPQGGSSGSNGPFQQQQTQTQSRSNDASIMAGVNPRLVAAVRGGAALALPTGYRLEAQSGARSGQPTSFHSGGRASDWQIVGPNGAIPNSGDDATGMYTRLARGVKTWASTNDPALVQHIGWGGAFGTQLGGGGPPDLMHFDLGGSRGNMRPDRQFARLQPLAANERNTSAPAQQAQQQPATAQQQVQRVSYGRLPTEAELADKNVPVGERFNNPFNMWYDKYAGMHGGADPKKQVTEHDRPASFPSKLDGAAAAIRKMANSPLYSGKTMTDLIATWVGHGVSYAPIIEKATGISRNTPITPAFLRSEAGLNFLKTMARYETKWEREYPLTDAQWRQARDHAFGQPRVATAQATTPTQPAQPAQPAVIQSEPTQGRPAGQPGYGGPTVAPQMKPTEAFNPLKAIANVFDPSKLFGVKPSGSVAGVEPTRRVATPGTLPTRPAQPAVVASTPPTPTPTPTSPVPIPPERPAEAPGRWAIGTDEVVPMPQPRGEPVPPARTSWDSDYVINPQDTLPQTPNVSQQEKILSGVGGGGAIGEDDPALLYAPKPTQPEVQPPDVAPTPTEPTPTEPDAPGVAEVIPRALRDDASAIAAGETVVPQPNILPTFNFQRRRELANSRRLEPLPTPEAVPPLPTQTTDDASAQAKPTTSALTRAIFGDRSLNLSTQAPPPLMELPPVSVTTTATATATDPTAQPTTQSAPWNAARVQEVIDAVTSSGRTTLDAARVIEEAMRQWSQEKGQGLRDWYYGPKSVKTQPVGMPKSTTPVQVTKKGPADTGLQVPQQQPLVLIPNRKPTDTGPAFSGPVVGAPSGGGVVAPPIGTGAPKVIPGGGVPKVVDPSSPTGYKYLTPEEIQQQQQPPVVNTTTIEDPQLVE